VTERLRVREIDDDEGRRLVRIVRRGSGSVVTWRRALLGGGRREVVAVGGDMRDPKAILAHDGIRAAGFDPDAPACVVLACVLHFVDAETAQGIAGTFVQALARGSYVVISVGFGRGRAGTDFASTYNAQHGPRIYAHAWEEITAPLVWQRVPARQVIFVHATGSPP